MSLLKWLEQAKVRSGEPAQKRQRSAAETSDCVDASTQSSLSDVYSSSDGPISSCSQCGDVELLGDEKELVNLAKMRTELGQFIQKHEKNQKDLGKMPDKIKQEAREAEDSSEAAIVCVIDSLRNHFRSVRELIRSQEDAAVAQVCDLLQSLPVKLEEMKRREDALNSMAEPLCRPCFHKRRASVSPLCEEDLHQGFPDVSQDLLLPFKRVKDAVEKLGKQLEEICNKEFASLSQSAVSAAHSSLTEQDVEPKTREEFLQYACELFLDPATAHVDLNISGGDKEVKIGIEKRPADTNLERFLRRPQVLCRTSLQAKRCYYEVEVKGDKAEIGLAYKGINRKSFSQSHLGGNEKSWSLDILPISYSVSHKRKCVLLTSVPTHHPTIGVYLEFEKGALTFYEVADDMKFLYKVQHEFTEPLYPAFWLGDNCSITICDLNPRL